MSGLAGQAAHAAGRVLRVAGEVVLLLLILLLGGALALAWRLDRGPLDLPWVARRLEAAAHERGIDVRLGRVALAWSAFHADADAPLELVLADARSVATDRLGAPLAQFGRVELTFSVPRLLTGSVVPRTLAVSALRAQLARQADGTFTLGLPADRALSVTETARRVQRGPPRALGPAEPIWRRLRHARLHDVRIAAFDARIGVAWDTSVELDLDRDAAGAISGHAVIALAASGQTATLRLAATPAPEAGASDLRAEFSPIDPAAIGALAPALQPFGMLDATVTVGARVSITRRLTLAGGDLRVDVGPGTVHAGQGSAPLLGASVRLHATPAGADATLSMRTAAAPDRPVTTITGTLHADSVAAGYRARLLAGVDQLSFADLPALWPLGTGGPGSRPWITENIPAGELNDGHMNLVLRLPPDLSDVAVESIDAGIDGHDMEVHWLRPVPPIVHAEGHLSVTDPNVIDIAVSGAKQAGGTHGGIVYRDAHVRITGVNDPDQFADIDTDIAGPLADLLTVLSNPRVKLLSKRPVPMHDPAGRVTAAIHVGHLPLRDDVSMDDLAIRTTAHLTGVHLGGIAAGRDLSDGDLTLTADNDGLQVGGRADIAGLAATLRVAMDFRAGPPDEVIQQVQVSGTLTEQDLARQGLDPGGLFKGSATLRASLATQRGGHGDIQLEADATDAMMRVPGLGFDKPAGQATHGVVRATLEDDRLASIDLVQVEGPEVDVLGHADIANGRPQVLQIERLRLGPGTDAHGTVRLPATHGDPYRVELAGPSLDAAEPFQAAMQGRKTGPGKTVASKTVASKTVASKTGPSQTGVSEAAASQGKRQGTPFTVKARFDRVLLGEGRRIDDFDAFVDNDGDLIRAARASGTVRGKAAAPGAFSLAIEPERRGRRASARIPDTGALLGALAVTDAVRGGALALDGHFDDELASHPLSGTVVVDRLRLLDAPLVARILKAATLYGIVDLLRGPGVSFTRLVVPFHYADGELRLRDARLISPSLGGTAHGSIELGGHTLDLHGTIVPAYALNTLPGRIPLIGRLFSPEKSGGVFAATFALRGALDDPSVSVDPLSVVAPGMLRNLLKLF